MARKNPAEDLTESEIAGGAAAPAEDDAALIQPALRAPGGDDIRAWLETPAGRDWLADERLRQVAARPAARPSDDASLILAARAVGVDASEVLGFRDTGDGWSVVTADGRKLSAPKG